MSGASRPADSPSPPWGRLTTGVWRMQRRFSRWRPQGTRDWLLKLTTGGTGRFGHAGGALPGALIVQRWDMVLLEPGVPHDYGIHPGAARWEFAWAHFMPRAEWLPLLQWPMVHGIRHVRLSEPGLGQRVFKRFRELHQCNSSSLAQRELFALNALEEVILWCSTATPSAAEVQVDPRIRRCMERMCQCLAEPLDNAALAALAGLSQSRFAHLFKHELDCTPQEFLTTQRLARARQLLAHSTRTVADIAEEVGFQSQFYFSLRFKARTGMSPSLYRQRAEEYDPLARDTSENRTVNLPTTYLGRSRTQR